MIARAIERVFHGVNSALYFPYAQFDYEENTIEWAQYYYNGFVPTDAIHWHKNPRKAIERAEGFFFDGGNSFMFLNSLLEHGLINLLRERLLGGAPGFAVSAGTNIACPTIQTTNDMPIVWPRSPKGLNLVPFQINTHYIDPHRKELHRGETRDERLAQYLKANQRERVLALREGSFIIIENDTITLHGNEGGKLFFHGCPPTDLKPGADLTDVLTSPFPCSPIP